MYLEKHIKKTVFNFLLLFLFGRFIVNRQNSITLCTLLGFYNSTKFRFKKFNEPPNLLGKIGM